MRISNLFKKLRRIPKRYLAVIATGLVIAVPVAVHAGFGPDRMTFDWNNNPGTCDLQANRGDRCGAISPTFDSFINTPSYGDERNFTRIAPVVAGQAPNDASYTETQTATAGQEYWVRTLVHNDANQNLNCDPSHRDAATNDCTQVDPGSPGIATGTKVSLQIAGGVANGVDVMTKVSADNATPGTIWDTATLANQGQAFSVSYVPGSAALYNGVHPTGTPLPDSILSAAGTAIGYNQMDGVVPGCFDFSAYVYVKVKVNVPALTLQKQVRFKGEDGTKWRDALTAKSGDQVQYLLDFKDTGSEQVNNIVIRDQLPANINVVSGSVKWIDVNHPAPGQSVPDSILFTKAGVLLGNYGINGGGYVMFDATIANTDKSACVANNVAFVRGDNVPEQSSTATVTISDCQPPQPIFSCSVFGVSKGDHTVTVNQFQTTASGGAVFKDVTINWNDNSQSLVTNTPLNQSHTYTSDGPFNITAQARFTVNGQDVTAPIGPCAQVVSFTTLPTSLPNTGPGDVIGIFTAVTIAGALIHRFVLGRNTIN